MAVSVYTTAELDNICKMPETAFVKRVLSMTLKQGLMFRRDLQVSLARYSKRIKAVGEFDPIQAGIIRRCYIVEKMCRRAFIAAVFPKALKVGATMGLDRRRVKADVLNKWEKLIARSSF